MQSQRQTTDPRLGLVGCFIVFALKATAADIAWTNTAGGNWAIGSNWSPNAVPGAADNAYITNYGSFTVTISSNGPDLTGSWTTPVTQICKNSSKGQRCTLRGTFTVMNIGNRDAPSTSVDFYLSDDATLDKEDLYLKWSSTGTMKASRSKGMKFSYTLPQGQNASGRYIIAIIDVDNTVTELDKENNVVVFGPIP